MVDSLVWLKENIEENDMRNYVDWVNWKRQKEENHERNQVVKSGIKEF